jgi:maltose alpha-D-glucosyltransferase/alpha-amylase
MTATRNGSERRPDWYKDAVIYETHVRAFFDSDADGIGDFPGMSQKLDYLRDLGVTTIWLLPFYPSPLKDDGYDIADYTSVHPAYGTLEDFTTFLAAAHRRGLRVITELVVNHTSDQHPWFQRARRAAPGSPERNFYVWSDTPERYQDARIIFKDFESSNWSWDPVAGAYFWHRFYAHQPDLNYEQPEVRQAVFAAMDFWLELGVDGLRLDAVPYLVEEEGTDCENLPGTHAILKELRRHIDARFADRMLLAEANQWPEDAIAYFGDGDECHMAFHFPLMPRIFMAVHTEDRFPIVDILAQTPQIPDSCQWALFLRNHDELTLEMVTDEERLYMYRVYAQAPEARINLGIRRRLAPLLGNSRRRIELVNGLLFSLPGTPVIYYGDEIGMGDNIYLGDRNGVRTPMQWSADRNAGFSRAEPQRLYLPLIVDHEYHYESVHVEAQEQNPHSLLRWMRGLIARRKRHRALARGTLELLRPANWKVLAYVRRYEDEQILVVANLSRFVQAVELDLSAFRGLVPVELFGRNEFWPIGDEPYRLTLGPHAFFWFALAPPRVARVAAEAARAATAALSVPGAWDDCVRGEAKGGFEEIMPVVLPTRPWFRRTTAPILSASVVEAIPVPAGEGTAYLALISVAYADRVPDTYALPLTFAADAGDAVPVAGIPPQARLARLTMSEADGEVEGTLFDASWDQAFAAELLVRITEGGDLKGADGAVVAVRTGPVATAESPLTRPEPRVLELAQSNTTIRYGDQYVLKLFRRLDDGVNPEWELGAFLAEQEFPRVPPLVGALEYRRRRREPVTLAVLHRYVPHQGTAWDAVQTSLADYLERALMAETPPAAPEALTAAALLNLAAGAIPDDVELAMSADLVAARQLGRRAAELHQALAAERTRPAFAPTPYTPFAQRELYQTVRGEAGRVMRNLRQALDDLPEGAQPAARAILDREAAIVRRLEEILATKLSGAMTRVHGDFHLGQILSTDGDYVFIDFEGEAERPLGERALKHSPLRDVASLLCSYQRAGYVALDRRAHAVKPDHAPQVQILTPWVRGWSAWVAAAVLQGYLEIANEAKLLPPDRRQLAALLDVQLLDRGLATVARAIRPEAADASAALQAFLDLVAPAARTGSVYS